MNTSNILWIVVVLSVGATMAFASDDSVATLNSLEKIDDYPLYTMTYYGDYDETASFFDFAGQTVAYGALPSEQPAWACSLFAAFADEEQALYGRNFDWYYSPALLLFTDPSDGYASVSMVDLAYFFDDDEAGTLTELSIEERAPLLYTPSLPFDGMNEHGLVVGMAAVPDTQMPYDRHKPTIDYIALIREMLDHARTVDEAIDIMGSYNLDVSGGPYIHYLIADATGDSVLVEFYEGEMIVIPNEDAWQVATNFLRVTAGESAEGVCGRYDAITQYLTAAEGEITAQDAMDILAEVSAGITQWSIVYGMGTGEVHVAMGQDYEDVHLFQLDGYSGDH